MYSLQPSSTSITLTNSYEKLTFFNENIGFENIPKFVGDINIDKSGKQKWNMTVSLRYRCKYLNSPVKIFCKLI